MKRICFAILILAVVLTGCYQKGTVADTGLYEPHRIADANVPLASKLNTVQFDKVAKLENDSYGRGYFSYKTYSTVIRSDIEIHIISQGVYADQVLYYPDICYMIRLEGGEPFAEEQIAQFKAQNDWEQPIIEEKAYSVSYSEGHKKDIAYERDIESAVLQYWKPEGSYGVLYSGMEITSDGKQLFFVDVFSRGEDGKGTGDSTYYLVVIDAQESIRVVARQKVEDPLNCQEQVQAFRAKYFVQKKTE